MKTTNVSFQTSRDEWKTVTKKGNVIFRTARKHPASLPEKNTLKSETVPDMSLSVQQIIDRFSKGQSLPQLKGGFYDEDIPDLRKMDRLERHDYLTAVREEVTNLKDTLDGEETMRKIQEKGKTEKDQNESSESKKESTPKIEETKSESETKAKTAE